jgi:hypothetical protein
MRQVLWIASSGMPCHELHPKAADRDEHKHQARNPMRLHINLKGHKQSSTRFAMVTIVRKCETRNEYRSNVVRTRTVWPISCTRTSSG